ncbi:DsbA family oxidoreductase [Rhodobacteraceae bacterium RKSG542]|uniref:DsbA family oxidoreductase n=1 Tax=Pseudovibrio flavus TaxID=2529854 RepID=UPI0012BC32B5|nr:DsbA family oxidoreductase [Pseudovibrio flavus]MTI17555.1 DsbA family oxidoreductase [Pseudovibrio flavus]
MSKPEPIEVAVISDVMCPWCFIGEKNLKAALNLLPSIPVRVKWLPFQLDGTLPPEGKDRQQYLEDKFGGAEAAQSVYANIKKAGLSAGIDFAFDKITRSPNTLNIHRVIKWAEELGLQSAVVEAFFKAYFLEGKDLTKLEVIAETAASGGMNQRIVADRLNTDEDIQTVKQMINEAHNMGVSGVPFFVIDQRFALSGAQPAETLAAAIQHADTTRAAS